jgi:hypothetical protein
MAAITIAITVVMIYYFIKIDREKILENGFPDW